MATLERKDNTSLVCPYPYIAPDCTETYASVCGTYKVQQAFSLLAGIILLSCQLFQLSQVYKQRKRVGATLHFIVFSLLLLSALCIFLRGLDPAGYDDTIPFFLINLFGYTASAALYTVSTLIILLWDTLIRCYQKQLFKVSKWTLSLSVFLVTAILSIQYAFVVVKSADPVDVKPNTAVGLEISLVVLDVFFIVYILHRGFELDFVVSKYQRQYGERDRSTLISSDETTGGGDGSGRGQRSTLDGSLNPEENRSGGKEQKSYWQRAVSQLKFWASNLIGPLYVAVMQTSKVVKVVLSLCFLYVVVLVFDVYSLCLVLASRQTSYWKAYNSCVSNRDMTVCAARFEWETSIVWQIGMVITCTIVFWGKFKPQSPDGEEEGVVERDGQRGGVLGATVPKRPRLKQGKGKELESGMTVFSLEGGGIASQYAAILRLSPQIYEVGTPTETEVITATMYGLFPDRDTPQEVSLGRM